jgi:hypothetical protein
MSGVTVFIDPAKLPSRYRMKVSGDCIVPEVLPDALIEAEVAALVQIGDLVVPFLKQGRGQWEGGTTRASSGPTAGGVVVVVGSINPLRRYAIRADLLVGIHKALPCRSS